MKDRFDVQLAPESNYADAAGGVAPYPPEINFDCVKYRQSRHGSRRQAEQHKLIHARLCLYGDRLIGGLEVCRRHDLGGATVAADHIVTTGNFNRPVRS